MSTPDFGAIEKNFESDKLLETLRQSRSFERGKEIRVRRDFGGLWKSLRARITTHHESVLTAGLNSRIVKSEPD